MELLLPAQFALCLFLVGAGRDGLELCPSQVANLLLPRGYLVSTKSIVAWQPFCAKLPRSEAWLMVGSVSFLFSSLFVFAALLNGQVPWKKTVCLNVLWVELTSGFLLPRLRNTSGSACVQLILCNYQWKEHLLLRLEHIPGTWFTTCHRHWRIYFSTSVVNLNTDTRKRKISKCNVVQVDHTKSKIRCLHISTLVSVQCFIPATRWIPHFFRC